MDIVDIPHEVSEEVLEEQVLNIFDKRGKGESISPDHNESCHHISKTKKKTKKKRYSHYEILSTKRLPTSLAGQKRSGEIENGRLDLPESNKLFINRSLCPYYKLFWSRSKILQSFGKIHDFFYLC